MKLFRLLRLAAIIILLTWLAIEIHEAGHFVTYRLFGYHAHMSLQRVMPLGEVPAGIDHLAKVAGPAISLIAAAMLLLIARRGRGFGWVTASFTNASLRLFPCAMDLVRAIKGARPFSDEGEVAIAFTSTPAGRTAVILMVMIVALTLTVLAGRQYRFQKHRLAKSIAIYLLSLAVGVGVVIADELLGWSK